MKEAVVWVIVGLGLVASISALLTSIQNGQVVRDNTNYSHVEYIKRYCEYQKAGKYVCYLPYQEDK